MARPQLYSGLDYMMRFSLWLYPPYQYYFDLVVKYDIRSINKGFIYIACESAKNRYII